MNTPASPISIREALAAWTAPFKASLLAATIGLGAMGSTQAAVIPYTNDFSDTGSNVAFPNENLDANWTVSGGSYNFAYSSTTVNPSTTSISLTNVAGTSFTLQSQFTISSTGALNGNGETIGFGAFGANANFTGSGGSGGNAFYLADWQVANSAPANVGTLRIMALGDDSNFSAVNTVVDDNIGTSTLSFNLNTTYTMRLVGTYVGSTLNLNLSILDASGVQIGSSATATDTTPLTGTYFGYRNRIGVQGGSFNAAFDNFSVTPVPEPGTVALLGLGLGAALLMMRRRQS